MIWPLEPAQHANNPCDLCGPSGRTCDCLVTWGRRVTWPADPVLREAHALLRLAMFARPDRTFQDYPWFRPDTRGLPVPVLTLHVASDAAAPHYGCATPDPPRILLYTWPGQDPVETTVTLLHECAHLVTADRCPPGGDAHGPMWAHCYAVVADIRYDADLHDLEDRHVRRGDNVGGLLDQALRAHIRARGRGGPST